MLLRFVCLLSLVCFPPGFAVERDGFRWTRLRDDRDESKSHSEESKWSSDESELNPKESKSDPGEVNSKSNSGESESGESESDPEEAAFTEVEKKMNSDEFRLVFLSGSETDSKQNLTQSGLETTVLATASHLFLLNKTSLIVVANKNFSDAILLLIAALDETCRNLINRIAAFYLRETPPSDTLLDVIVYANNLFLERAIAHVTFANAFADEVLYGILEYSKEFLRRSKNDVVLVGFTRIAQFSTGFLRGGVAPGVAGLLVVGFMAAGDVAEKMSSFLN